MSVKDEEFFYSILDNGVSSKEVCLIVNQTPSNQNKIKCFEYEGGGIWIRTFSDEYWVKEKLEEELEINLGDPKINTNVEEKSSISFNKNEFSVTLKLNGKLFNYFKKIFKK